MRDLEHNQQSNSLQNPFRKSNPIRKSDCKYTHKINNERYILLGFHPVNPEEIHLVLPNLLNFCLQNKLLLLNFLQPKRVFIVIIKQKLELL